MGLNRVSYRVFAWGGGGDGEEGLYSIRNDIQNIHPSELCDFGEFLQLDLAIRGEIAQCY